MKKIILLIILIAGSFQSFCQTPGISYQAVILNPNVKELPGVNAPTSILANKTVAIRFTIINNASNQEYQEFHQTQTDAYGMINLLIGYGTPTGSTHFKDIVWNGLSKKLKVEIDFTNRVADFALLSEQELIFMPQPALGQDAKAILKNTAGILAEVQRATHAESVIQTTIDANETAAILADMTLQDNINNVQLNLDANHMATETALDLKVDKVLGKGLSTEDYTTLEKAKLAALAGSNTGDQDISGIAINMANIGDLTDLRTTDNLNMVAAVNEIKIEKADIESPSLTGIPLAPTAAVGTNTTQIANTAFVTDAITTAQTPDATATVKGKIQLAGDLSGTAAMPIIANGAVNTIKIADDSVTEDKIASAAVTTVKIDDAAVTSAKIATSPSFTGIPLAPTAVAGTNDNQIATTEFVTSLSSNYLPLTGGALTGSLTGTSGVFSSGLDAASLTVRNATKDWRFDMVGSSLVLHEGGCCNKLTIDEDGNFGIGANYVPSYKLDVEGDGRFTNAVIGNSFVKVGGTASQFLKADGSVDATAYASLISPSFTGTPLATTAIEGTNTTQIATTAFVTKAITGTFVDLSNTQTIAGIKTFSNTIIANGFAKSDGLSSEYLMADGSVSSGPSGGMAGSGTSNYVSKFTDASTLGNSNIYDNGTHVGIGTNAPSSMFQIGGEGNFDLNLKFDAADNVMSVKYGFRAQQWRLKTSTNSGVLTPFVFSHYNGTTDDTKLTITDTSVDIPNNLNVTGQTTGSSASFFGKLLVNTNQLSINGTTNRVGVFTDAPTSMFQIGSDGSHDNPLKYDYGGDQGVLKFVFRNNEFRMHSHSESGYLDNLIFSYFNNASATDTESMRISHTGLVTIKDLKISGGSPAAGKILTSDANGLVSWQAPQTNNPIREIADEFSAIVSQTSFTLTQTPSVNSKVKMYVNGIRISNSAYSVSGTTLTYVPANNGGYSLKDGDRTQMDYYY